MRKVLFLMILLLLMGLGAASVKAQVRIGGNAAPNASALLDLNATDATNNGTKGLALPRVNLTSNTMLLSGVTSNLTGMMVYNTTTTLGAIGIYYWNGATWVRASLPSTSAADSGKFLMSDGKSIILSAIMFPVTANTPSGSVNLRTQTTFTQVHLILDTVINLTFDNTHIVRVTATGLNYRTDLCFPSAGTTWANMIASLNFMIIQDITRSITSLSTGIRCYRFV